MKENQPESHTEMDKVIKLLGDIRDLIIAVIFLAVLTGAYAKITSISGQPDFSDCALEQHEELMGREKMSYACRAVLK